MITDSDFPSRWCIPAFQDIWRTVSSKCPRDLDSITVVSGNETHLIEIPHEVCEEFGITPLLLELCILRPKWAMKHDEDATAASLVHVAYDNDDAEVLKLWATSILDLVAGGNGATKKPAPLSAHASLYRSRQLFIPNLRVGLSYTAIDRKKHSSAFCWNYEYQVDSGELAGAKATRFAAYFLNKLKESNIAWLPEPFFMLMLPFSRPDTNPYVVDLVPTSENKHLQPAGVLFLLGHDQEHANGRTRKKIAALGDVLRSYLHDSALSESPGILDMVDQRLATENDLGHILKAIVSLTGWNAGCERLSEVLRTTTSEDTANSIRFAAKSLATFGFAEGLGQMLRARGIINREEHTKKLADWVDLEMLNSWRQGDSDRIRDVLEASIKGILTVVCGTKVTRGHIQVRFEVERQGTFVEVWTSNEEEDADLPVIKYLRCPPFSTKSAANCMLASAMMEPLKNASDYLIEVTNPSIPREIVVQLVVQLPSAIKIRIGNCVSKGEEVPLSSGVALTSQVLKDLRFASITSGPREECTIQPDGSRLTLFWVVIDLHANELAEKLLV